jgi:hypothetical protein
MNLQVGWLLRVKLFGQAFCLEFCSMESKVQICLDPRRQTQDLRSKLSVYAAQLETQTLNSYSATFSFKTGW